MKASGSQMRFPHPFASKANVPASTNVARPLPTYTPPFATTGDDSAPLV